VVARQAELHCGLDARRKARKNFNHEAHEEERKTAPSGEKNGDSVIWIILLRDMRRFRFLLRALCALRG
jgi:hypothetical protein